MAVIRPADSIADGDGRGARIKRVPLGRGVYAAVAEAADTQSCASPAVAGRQPTAARAWAVPLTALPIAAATALLAALRLGATRPGMLAAALLPLLVVLAAVDLRSRVVPNRIVFPAFVGVLAFQLALAPAHAAEWVVAAVGAPLVMLMPALIDRRAVGMGDVKLAALLGAALGFRVLGALMIGALAVVPVAAVVLVRGGRAARRTAIPFVPFLALGTAAVLLG
jgi:leader peptidase (prepilin peptidase) / N-methyltransferase